MLYSAKAIMIEGKLSGNNLDNTKTAHLELKGLRAMDPEVISDVHNRFYPAVYRFLCFRLGYQEAAEDLAAEVFVCLLEALHSGRGPEKNLRGWLMGTASHLANDYYRKKYSRPQVEITEQTGADGEDDPYYVAEQRENFRSVRARMEKLTDEQQQVLALRFGSGYSLEETAEAMGKKANAIKALQYRALEALRRELAGVEL